MTDRLCGKRIPSWYTQAMMEFLNGGPEIGRATTEMWKAAELKLKSDNPRMGGYSLWAQLDLLITIKDLRKCSSIHRSTN